MQTGQEDALRLFGESRRIRLLIAVTTPLLLLATAASALLGVGAPATTQAHWQRSSRCQPKITYGGISATPSAPAPGSSVQFRATMTASCATAGLIDFEVYNASGTRAWVNWKDNQQLTGKQQTSSFTWAIPVNLTTGAYTLKIGVFSPNWGKLYSWNNAALKLSVQRTATPAPTTTPAPKPPTSTPTPAPKPPTSTPTPVPTSPTSAPTPALKPPTATPTPAPKPPTSTPTPAPQPSGNFTLLPVGAQLPSDSDCAARVKRSSWEPRPDNATANKRNLYAEGVRAQWNGKDPAQSMMNRTTGNFTGTTDEIIQWAACKWGFDVDTVRAQAVQESDWHQSTLGDCRYSTQPETHGCASVGILQVKGANIPPTQPGTWPYAYESTAWNLDYALSVRRACFEGKISWLGNGYKAGDEWGCIGYWFSGHWYDSGAQTYINSVKAHMANKDWLKY